MSLRSDDEEHALSGPQLPRHTTRVPPFLHTTASILASRGIRGVATLFPSHSELAFPLLFTTAWGSDLRRSEPFSERCDSDTTRAQRTSDRSRRDEPARRVLDRPSRASMLRASTLVWLALVRISLCRRHSPARVGQIRGRTVLRTPASAARSGPGPRARPGSRRRRWGETPSGCARSS